MADGIGALAFILGACKISNSKIVVSVENGLATVVVMDGVLITALL